MNGKQARRLRYLANSQMMNYKKLKKLWKETPWTKRVL